MHEHITWEEIEEWVKEKPEREHQQEKLGKVFIGVGAGAIGIKNPKTGLAQIINPKDFGMEKLSPDAEIIAHKKDAGQYLVYVINPGSERLVSLELIFEGDMFGVYPKDFEVGEKITKKNYIVVNESTAAICTHKLLYVICGGNDAIITLEKAGVGEIRHPVFGVGKSEKHVWLAVKEKGADEALLVCLTDSDLGYSVRRKPDEGFRGKELLERD